jgi:hypothetical protein
MTPLLVSNPQEVSVRRTVVVLAVVAASGLGVFAADALSQMGITPADAKEMLMEGLSSDYVPLGYVSKAFKAAPPAVREQFVQGGLAWAKAYVSSPEFSADWARLRTARKPSEPHFDGTPEEEYQRQRAKATADEAKGQEDVKAMLAQMTPEQQKQVQEALKQAAALARQLDTPEMRKAQLDAIVQERATATKEFHDAMDKWAADYPAQPAALIARRLHEFLDVSATVDFSAKLEQRAGRAVFVNPAYQAKSDQWKLCYRAGQPAVTAARSAAQAWLKTLGS